MSKASVPLFFCFVFQLKTQTVRHQCFTNLKKKVFVSPSNLKIDLSMLKIFRKLQKKFKDELNSNFFFCNG